MFKRTSVLVISLLVASLGVSSPAHAKAYKCSKGGKFKVVGGVLDVDAKCKGAITIPASIKEISGGEFASATNLTKVSISNKSKRFSTSGGVLFDKKKTKLIAYPQAKTGSSYVVPLSVTTIDDSAFHYSRFLKTVTFAYPSKVQTISNYAFAGSSISSINIPASVATIGRCAFKNSTGLTSVTFDGGNSSTNWENRLRVIDEDVFFNTGLTSVAIPDSVTTIGANAFLRNRSLSTVTFGRQSKLTSIGPSAFSQSGIVNLSLPALVDTIGLNAFDQTPTLRTLTFASDSRLIRIEAFAFKDNQLSTVTIPASVTSIGAGAFENNQLTSVRFLGNAPVTPFQIFYGNPNLVAVYRTPVATGFTDPYEGRVPVIQQ